MFKLLQLMFVRSAAKRPATGRRAILRGRVESLESRCLLATTPLGMSLSTDGITFGVNSGVIRNADNSAELAVPQFDTEGETERPAESIPWAPLPEAPKPQEPTPTPTPPTGDVTPPSEDGGPVDIENSDDLGFSDPLSQTGQKEDSPPDVAAERETRAVLQMLSKLQYSLELGDSVSALNDSPFDGEFDGFLRELADLTVERYDDADREGGAVAIAIQEVTAEWDADRAWNDKLESLHDVSVEMDSASGRYQAFEVSTLEEGSVRFVPRHDLPADVTVIPEAEEIIVDVDGPSGAKLEDVLPANEAANEATGSTGVPLSLVSPPAADDSARMKWTSAVALVSLGIALQFFREWKLECLRTQAAFAWQQLVESPGWFGRRSNIKRKRAANKF